VPDNVWDTSAIVKLYVQERGSEHTRQLAESGSVVIASITIVEFASALRRRTIVGDLTTDQRDAAYRRFLSDAREFSLVEVTEAVRTEAARLLLDEPRVVGRLRGFDAVQLATARVWFETLRPTNIEAGVFIVADGSLREGAVALGLPVDNPEEHE
jgi:uncharacterized protein